MSTPRPLEVEYHERFRQHYSSLPPARQAACRRVIGSLIQRQSLPGARVRPILPEKRYFEARISQGDRLVFRIEGGVLLLIDIVVHDDIARYGRRP